MIGRRPSRLSDSCNQLLAIAAVIGREFDADILERMSGQAADAVDEALAEAVAAAVATELPGVAARYRFSHALIRETLAHELPTRRRLRLHGAVGEALEAHYGARAEQHAAELANHFVESGGGSATATKALTYSLLAAEQSEAATAWEEAARHYENCLTLLSDTEVTLVPGGRAAHVLGTVLPHRRTGSSHLARRLAERDACDRALSGAAGQQWHGACHAGGAPNPRWA